MFSRHVIDCRTQLKWLQGKACRDVKDRYVYLHKSVELAWSPLLLYDTPLRPLFNITVYTRHNAIIHFEPICLLQEPPSCISRLHLPYLRVQEPSHSQSSLLKPRTIIPFLSHSLPASILSHRLPVANIPNQLSLTTRFNSPTNPRAQQKWRSAPASSLLCLNRYENRSFEGGIAYLWNESRSYCLIQLLSAILPVQRLFWLLSLQLLLLYYIQFAVVRRLWWGVVETCSHSY